MLRFTLFFFASLSALAQTATFNAVQITSTPTVSNNAVTVDYTAARIGKDIPSVGTLSGTIGMAAILPNATTSTFSGWGQPVVVTNNWDTVEIYLFPFNDASVPSQLVARVRQLPADTNLWSNNPTTFTALATKTFTVSPIARAYNKVVLKFDTTFSGATNLYFEYECNGRDGGRLADSTATLTNLIPNPPGKWYTTAINGSGTWSAASARGQAFYAKFYISGSVGSLDWSSVLDSALPVPSRATVTVNLPETIWALEGREMNLYFRNFIFGPENETAIKVSSSAVNLGKLFGEWGGYWRYTPTAVTSTNSITFIASDANFQPVASKTTTVLTRPIAYPSTPVSRRLHCIGDSTLGASGVAVLAELVNLFNGDANYTLSLVGSNSGTNSLTLDSAGNLRSVSCDAISGWTAAWFATNSTTAWTTIGGSARTGSPFVYSGSFNYASFLSTYGITMSSGDVVLLHLGINDIFPATSDEELDYRATVCLSYLEQMIANIRSTVSGVRVAVCVTIPPNSRSESWGVDYNPWIQPTWDRYMRNRQLLANRIVTQFSGRQGSNIYCVAYGHTLDTVNGFSTTATAISARNSATYTRPSASAGIHPAPSGYFQLADTLRAFLKGIE